MQMDGWVVMNNRHFVINGSPLLPTGIALPATPEAAYSLFNANYPRFYKMDQLCKWALLGAHSLMDSVAENMNKTTAALVLSTANGCLMADKAYQQAAPPPSPALFVYTLPNIMLGEICIKHGFKGEQMCIISDRFNAATICAIASDLIAHQGMTTCILGWVNVDEAHFDVFMAHVRHNNTEHVLLEHEVAALYQQFSY